MPGARRLRPALLLLLALAGCSSRVPGHAAVILQLPARSSIGTGIQARLWAAGILAALDASPGSADIASMIAWFEAEDAHKAAGALTYGAGENNPLNLTEASGKFPGEVGFEPSGAGPGHPGNINFRTAELGMAASSWVIWEM